MNSTEQRLITTRNDLLFWQEQLRKLRIDGHDSNGTFTEAMFCRALDRLWEAQSMAEPRL